jgi:serine/threonine protein phosphatase PrpC
VSVDWALEVDVARRYRDADELRAALVAAGGARMKLFRSRPAGPPLRAAMRTDPGRIRSRNEDACLVDPEQGLFAVADGMGGHPAGDVAARVAIEHLPGLVRDALARTDPTGVDAAVEEAVLGLNEVVIAEASTSPDLTGMGSTLVMALVSGYTAHVAHAGDSRAYLLRDGRLRRLTEDHSFAAALIDGGVLDPEEAARHPFAQSLTQAIGMPGTRPDVQRVELATGDRLLLCSDGLTRMVPEDRIGRLLAAGQDPDRTSQALVDAANGAGGHDNVSVVLVDVLAVDGAGPPILT